MKENKFSPKDRDSQCRAKVWPKELPGPGSGTNNCANKFLFKRLGINQHGSEIIHGSLFGISNNH